MVEMLLATNQRSLTHGKLMLALVLYYLSSIVPDFKQASDNISARGRLIDICQNRVKVSVTLWLYEYRLAGTARASQSGHYRYQGRAAMKSILSMVRFQYLTPVLMVGIDTKDGEGVYLSMSPVRQS
jgi:hypothetical protein